MKIDNFNIIRQHLTFEPAFKLDAKTKKLKQLNDTYDRYVVQIIKRAKDNGGKEYGVNVSNRLLKTYEISSLEYFDKKREHIIDLCDTTGARAYILPQVRSTYDCLKEMLRLGLENLENPTVKFQHIIRSSLCAVHTSRDKKWILDLDDDNMTEFAQSPTDKTLIKAVKWTVEDIEKLVGDELEAVGKSKDDMFTVKTPHGFTIVTPPFNLQHAQTRCSMMYSGVQTHISDVKYTGPGEYDFITSKMTGWLIKDGMALLYFNGSER